jgi:hypothetical protein
VDAVSAVDRLVLLGDVVELRDGPLRDALAAAGRVLAEIGDALRPGSEVVLVPGNHDHFLTAGWSARVAAAGPPPALGLQAELDWVAGEPLAELAGAVGRGGARVRACYPGIWLRDDMYAMHGHQLDRHTTVPAIERLAAGLNGRLLGRPLERVRSVDDYEAVLAPSYAWIHAVAQWRATGDAAPAASHRLWRALGSGRHGGDLGLRARRAGAAAAIALMNRAGIGPLRADLSARELRRAGLIAFGAVLTVLSVPARYVIFGHTHRAGPIPGDEAEEWSAPTGTRLLNTGCWVHEASFLGPRPSASPYRAGFGARVDDDGPPELVNLLDAVTDLDSGAIQRR